MPEGIQGKTLGSEARRGPYLSENFIEQAPVDDGAEEMLDYLFGKLPIEINKAMKTRYPTVAEAAGATEELRMKLAGCYSDILLSYVQCVEAHYKARANDERTPWLEGWRQGIEQAILTTGLGQEQAMIDDLFKNAASIKVEVATGTPIEGKVVER